jgi:ABC-type bacteriocin/lantibiotic exporter with double-glycine peptidase domain
LILERLLRATTLRKVLGYLPRFLSFTYRRFPLARVVLLLTLLGIVLEYATLSLMVPLVRSGSGSSGLAQSIVSFWSRIAAVLDFPASQQTWLWMFLLLFALRIVAGYAQITLNIYVAKKIHAFLSDKIFRRVVAEEPLARIFQRSIGYYVSLAGDETHKAGNIFFYVGQAAAAGLSAAAGLALLLVFSPRSFWLTVGFIGVCGLLVGRGMRVVLTLSSESLHLSRSLNTNFIEALNGLRSVRSLSAETFVIHGYRDQIRRYVRGLFRIDALTQGYKALPALMLTLLGVIWLWPGTTGSQGATTLFFFAVTTMLIRILTALGEFVTAGGKLVADIRASQDAGELLNDADLAPPVGLARLSVPIVRIEMREVVCGYDRNKVVLRDVCGEFKVGTCYAIIGKSGAGKSTFADVLLGILPISAGQILVNDQPLESIDPPSLRGRIILVEQQTRIFTGSLRDNVKVGFQATEAEIQRAVQVAGLEEFVRELPDGLDTQLEYQGANLSGGQRQRIGIARALIRHPDVLILDEGTSAVDPPMRKALLGALRQEFAGKILIFITHDSEVLTAADEIWRVEDTMVSKEAGVGRRVGTATVGQ